MVLISARGREKIIAINMAESSAQVVYKRIYEGDKIANLKYEVNDLVRNTEKFELPI